MEETKNVNVQSKKLLIRGGFLAVEGIIFIIVLIVCISRIHLSNSNYRKLTEEHKSLLVETAKQRKNIAFFSKNIRQYDLKKISGKSHIYEIRSIKEYIRAIGLYFGFNEEEYKKQQKNKNNDNGKNVKNTEDNQNDKNTNQKDVQDKKEGNENKNSEFSNFVMLFEENKNNGNNSKNNSNVKVNGENETANNIDDLKQFIKEFTYSDKKLSLNDNTIKLSFSANYEYVVFKIINIFEELLPGYVVMKNITISPNDNDGKYFYYDFKFKDRPIKKEIQDRLKCNVELQWIVLTNNK
jgi:hypothetical protein